MLQLGQGQNFQVENQWPHPSHKETVVTLETRSLAVRVSLKKSNYFLEISQKWFDFDTQRVPGALENIYRHSKSSRTHLSGSGSQIGAQTIKKKQKVSYMNS